MLAARTFDRARPEQDDQQERYAQEVLAIWLHRWVLLVPMRRGHAGGRFDGQKTCPSIPPAA